MLRLKRSLIMVVAVALAAMLLPSTGLTPRAWAAPTSARSEQVPDLVAYWPFDGDGRDVVGGHDAAIINGAVFGSGQSGQALLVNGSMQGARVPASAGLDVGQAPGFTISAWINPNDIGEQPIVEWFGTDWGVNLWLYNAPGAPTFNVRDTSNINRVIWGSSGAVQAGRFQHLVATYDKASSMGRIYLNGALVMEGNLGQFTPQTSYDLFIGYTIGAGYQCCFRGSIDEVKLFSRAISAEEVSAVGAGSAPQPADALGTSWSECETGINTNTPTVCGTFIRQADTGLWSASWENGALATLSITLDGSNITIVRTDTNSGLRATYYGVLAADGLTASGVVSWCCDSGGPRVGTWVANTD